MYNIEVFNYSLYFQINPKIYYKKILKYFKLILKIIYLEENYFSLKF